MATTRKLTELEQQVIDHVERYRLTIPAVVAKLFCGAKRRQSQDAGEKAQRLLTNLCRKGVFASHEFPSKKSRFYTLAGAKIEPSSVDYDLSLVWWCTMGKDHRQRVRREDLVPIFGDQKAPRPQFRHCIATTNEGRCCLYRMYPTTATRQQIMLQIRKKHLAELRKLHAEMVACGDLGLAVLVAANKTKQHLQRELKRTTKHRQTPLVDQARIVVDLAPNSQTIDEWLK